MADFVRAIDTAHRAGGSRRRSAPQRRAHRSVLPPAAAARVPVRIAAPRRPRAGVHREGLMITPLTNATVLVTGATGFIGGRLAERLVVEHGARVRALVRNFGRAARLARYPIELVQGDLKSAESVDRAASPDATTSSTARTAATARTIRGASSTRKAPRHVLDAALKHGVQARRAHQHGHGLRQHAGRTARRDGAAARRPASHTATARSRRRKPPSATSRAACPVAVVQPTVVYGPFGTTFTVKPLTGAEERPRHPRQRGRRARQPRLRGRRRVGDDPRGRPRRRARRVVPASRVRSRQRGDPSTRARGDARAGRPPCR